jgi:hypothetical protein
MLGKLKIYKGTSTRTGPAAKELNSRVLNSLEITMTETATATH